MRTSLRVGAFAIAATIVLGACGSGDAADTTVPDAPAAASGVGSIALADGDFGQIVVDQAGLTLYGFTDDIAGESTCYDACAEAWPPVSGDAQVGSEIDASLVRTVQRDDGTTQLAIGDWPLYHFAGDSAPGDVNGQGSGDVWFVVDAGGNLVTGQETAAPDGQAADTPGSGEQASGEQTSGGQASGGQVLTDADGLTLYVFANDTSGVSNCNEPCSDTWPPVYSDETVYSDESVPIDPLRLDLVTRADGTQQLAIDGFPLYRYIGDTAPGDVNGQEVGGVWFAVGSDGETIRPAGLRIGSTDIGDVLIDVDGFTLYTFVNDSRGVSTCNAPCSDTWPPVPGDTRIDASVLDPSQFGVITRDDGSLQLTIGGYPLYRYAGDTFPGDANGVAVGGGIWQGVTADLVAPSADANGGVVSVSDQPVEDGAGLSVGETDLGPTLVDGSGLTLYGFLDDSPEASACDGACADAWPPVPGDTPLPADIDAELFHVIERPDGSSQLAFGDWPLYRFSGDTGPGDINGQGSGDVWFAVSARGGLYR